jgi:hypothetical protein
LFFLDLLQHAAFRTALTEKKDPNFFEDLLLNTTAATHHFRAQRALELRTEDAAVRAAASVDIASDGGGQVDDAAMSAADDAHHGI